MHRVPRTRLTLPAVAGRGLSEGLGFSRVVGGYEVFSKGPESASYKTRSLSLRAAHAPRV
jgi:hypothetical protein